MIPKLFIVDDEEPARLRLMTLLSDIAAGCPHTIVGQADHAQAALDGITASRPDIVLLDIQMPGMNGIELASHLANQNELLPAVIFVTAFDAYALKAFEVRAIDYLVKPVRASRLAEALRRAISLHVEPSSQRNAISSVVKELGIQRESFSVQERGRLLFVPVADVLYLKAELKYVTLHTKLREFMIEESLLSLEQEFSQHFIRVHRNTLVARHAILGVERTAEGGQKHAGEKALDSWQVVLRDVEEHVPISRRQWPIIKAMLSARPKNPEV